MRTSSADAVTMGRVIDEVMAAAWPARGDDLPFPGVGIDQLGEEGRRVCHAERSEGNSEVLQLRPRRAGPPRANQDAAAILQAATGG